YKNTLNTRFIYTKKANKSNALNIALKQINEDSYVFFTDDDARFSPTFLIEYYKKFIKYPNGCYFGGPVEVDYEEEPPSYFSSYLPLSVKGWNPDVNQQKNLIKFLGVNWAAKASDLKACGYFNNIFGPGSKNGATGQEHEMQMRLYELKLKPIFIPDAIVWHFVPKIKSSFSWVIRRTYKNGIGFGMKINDSDRKKIFGVPLYLIKKFLRIKVLPVLKIYPFFFPDRRFI